MVTRLIFPVKGNLPSYSSRRGRLAAVVAAGQALRPEHVQDREGHIDVGHQLSVDVELAARRHPFTLSGVGLAGRFELVTQLDFTLRNYRVGLEPEFVATQVVVEEIQSLFLDEEG